MARRIGVWPFFFETQNFLCPASVVRQSIPAHDKAYLYVPSKMRQVYNTVLYNGNKAAKAALLVFVGVLLSVQSFGQFYNGSQMEFGKS